MSFVGCDENVLVDIKSLATMLDVQVRTVHRMLKRDELPPGFVLNGKRIWRVGQIIDHWKEAEVYYG